MPFLTNVPLPQCLQHSSATRRLLARDHDRGCMRYLLEVKCLYKFFFPLVKGEINGRAFHANDSRCRMIKGAAKVVDDISSKQWEICRNVLGSFNLQAVLTGLRIVLYPHAIRLISGDVAQKGVE